MKIKKKIKLKKAKFKFKGIGFVTILILLMDIIVIAGLVVINTNKFKSFWIPTAMTTKSHKYLAYTLYSEDLVWKIMSENYIEKNTEEVNLDDIVIGQVSEKKHYSNKYEKELFTKDEGNDVYKTIRIIEPGYKGWLIGIYDPSDVELAVSSRLGIVGQNVSTLIRNNGGLVGING